MKTNLHLSTTWFCWLITLTAVQWASGAGAEPGRTYTNLLVPMANPEPLLADYPEWVEPIRDANHFAASPLVVDDEADLHVRAWRYSYNARGIIEIPNELRAAHTAVITVHPWGIDDGQGWKTPEPAGVADFCTPVKNHLAGRHTREVINPFLKSLRGKVSLIMFSLTGKRDDIRKKLYRSFNHTPTEEERRAGQAELQATLSAFHYEGEPLPREFKVSAKNTVADYFKEFPGLDSGPKYNNAGFWNLPVPVTRDVEVDPDDVVIYDDDGYEALKTFLQKHGIRHILLAGYATDMCFARTCAGYENLSKDFNVFLVGDATLATFPASLTPRFATSAHLSFASLGHLITQISWIRSGPKAFARPLGNSTPR